MYSKFPSFYTQYKVIARNQWQKFSWQLFKRIIRTLGVPKTTEILICLTDKIFLQVSPKILKFWEAPKIKPIFCKLRYISQFTTFLFCFYRLIWLTSAVQQIVKLIGNVTLWTISQYFLFYSLWSQNKWKRPFLDWRKVCLVCLVSNNGREFVHNFRVETIKTWPGECKLVNG